MENPPKSPFFKGGLSQRCLDVPPLPKGGMGDFFFVVVREGSFLLLNQEGERIERPVPTITMASG